MVGKAERIFERTPLSSITQEDVESGKAFTNLYFFVHTLLYDFPEFVENPDKVEELLTRWREGKATKFDRIVAGIIRDRLLALNEENIIRTLKLEVNNDCNRLIPSPKEIFKTTT